MLLIVKTKPTEEIFDLEKLTHAGATIPAIYLQ